MIPDVSDFYVTGGTLSQDTPSYVARRADSELYRGLRRGEFCYVLTARQMGKSSLMVRTAERLREDGFTVATLDLTMVGQNLTIEQWYYGLLNLLGRQLGLRPQLREFWLQHAQLSPLQRFMTALREVVLEQLVATEQHTSTAVAGLQDPSLASAEESTGAPSPLPAPPSHTHHACAPRLVLFIDEIDTVLSLPFSTGEFFAAIRECYNRRSEDPALEGLTFCLLGVASPSDLIRDPRTTPFNIGLRIELQDFTLTEAGPLAVGLQLGAAGAPLRSPRVALRLLRRIHYWTDGHPYLTQRLCRAVAEDPTARDRRGVDRICRRLFLEPGAQQRDDNLLFVQERLTSGGGDTAGYLELYSRIRAGRPVPCDERDLRVPTLRLSGIIGVRRNLLRVRNRIYYTLFDQRWVQSHLPDAEVRRQLAAYRRGLLRSTLLSSLVILALAGLSVGLFHQRNTARRASATYALQRGIQLLRDGDGTGLLDLLEAYRTAGGDRDLQQSIGRIWAGWYNTHAGRLMEVLDAGEDIAALAVRPDARQLAVGGAQGGLRLYNTSNWTSASPALRHPEPLTQLVYAARRPFLAGRGDHMVQVWDHSGSRLLHRFRSPDRIRAVSFVGSGELLAVRTTRQVHLWETTGWHAVPSPNTGTDGVVDAAFGPGRDRPVALATTHGVILHWLRSGRQHLLRLPEGGVNHLQFNSTGKLLALSWGDRLRLWDVERRSFRPEIFNSPEPIKAVQFGPRDCLIAQSEEMVRLWSTSEYPGMGLPLPHGAEIRTTTLPERGPSILTLSASRIRLWDLATGRERASVANQGGFGAVACDPQFRWIASAPTGSTLRIWKFPANPSPNEVVGRNVAPELAWYQMDGSALHTADRNTMFIRTGHTGRRTTERRDLRGTGYRLAVSPQREFLATTGTGSLHLWNGRTGDPLGRPLPHTGVPSCLDFSPSGKQIALGSDSRHLWISDTATNQLTRPPLELPFAPQYTAFSTVGSWVAAADTKRIEVHSLNGQAEHYRIQPEGAIFWIGFIPGTQVLIAAAGNTLTQYDCSSGSSQLRVVHLPARLRSVACDYPRGRLAIATKDHQVRILGLHQMQPVGPELRLEEPVSTMAFSADGTSLATCTAFRMVQVWDLRTGQPTGQRLAHPTLVRTLEFHPEGEELAALTDSGLHLWKLPRPEVSLQEMQRMSWVALDTWSIGQAVEAIPAGVWRRMRDGLRARLAGKPEVGRPRPAPRIANL